MSLRSVKILDLPKIEMTDEEILIWLIAHNSQKIGPNMNPMVASYATYTLTGRKQDTANGKVNVFWDTSKPSKADIEANPGLTPSRYLRVSRTIETRTTAYKPGEKMSGFQTAEFDNLFENQNKDLFAEIMRQLYWRNDDPKDPNYNKLDINYFFEPLADDANLNPRIRMRNAIHGVFIDLTVPTHGARDPKDPTKLMANKKKDRRTGLYETEPTATPFRTMSLFLVYPGDLGKLEDIAIKEFKNTVLPFILETKETIITEDGAGGTKTEKKVLLGDGSDDLQKQIVPEHKDTDPPTPDKKVIDPNIDPMTGKVWGG